MFETIVRIQAYGRKIKKFFETTQTKIIFHFLELQSCHGFFLMTFIHVLMNYVDNNISKTFTFSFQKMQRKSLINNMKWVILFYFELWWVFFLFCEFLFIYLFLNMCFNKSSPLVKSKNWKKKKHCTKFVFWFIFFHFAKVVKFF